MKKAFAILSIIAAFMLAACTSEKQDQGNGEECPCSEPVVIVSGITEESAEINIDPGNADTFMYLYVPKSDGTPSPETVWSTGTKLEESSFILSDLDAETDYIFALASKCPHAKEFFTIKEFKTIKDDAVIMADGFMGYDGLDAASGRYRLNIMMSTEKMGEHTGNYYDVIIYVYLKYDLERIDDMTREVPFGKITPFYTDGQQLGDMVYYIGKHFSDNEGENAQGTAVFKYDNDVTTEIIVADDTENTSLEIVDNGDGTYTVKGIIADLNGKSFKFKFTDDKAVFSLDQTGM